VARRSRLAHRLKLITPDELADMEATLGGAAAVLADLRATLGLEPAGLSAGDSVRLGGGSPPPTAGATPSLSEAEVESRVAGVVRQPRLPMAKWVVPVVWPAAQVTSALACARVRRQRPSVSVGRRPGAQHTACRHERLTSLSDSTPNMLRDATSTIL
jgi:hypothetical protein